MSLCVCIPCFNERWEELEETILSLEENLLLLQNPAKRSRFKVGCTMVIVQDGVGKAHPSMVRGLVRVFGEGCLPPRPREEEATATTEEDKWTYVSELMAPVPSVALFRHGSSKPQCWPLRSPSSVVYLVLVCKGENRRKHNRSGARRGQGGQEVERCRQQMDSLC